MESGDQEKPLVEGRFERLLDSREAAAYLRVHYKTLEAKARLGLVPAMKEGKSWLFRLSLLDEYIDHKLKSNVTNHAALTPDRKDQEQ
ncbi:MAG: helix-turn-helix domain-containing protein [Acidobacteriota bacterium]